MYLDFIKTVKTDIKKLYNILDFDFSAPKVKRFLVKTTKLSSGQISFCVLGKVKICGAEVWSSEAEVKLLEGHGGEVHSLTCRDDFPSLWPYLEM